MEDPSDNEFSQLTDQVNNLLNEMLPSVGTTIDTNGIVNVRMVYSPRRSNMNNITTSFLRQMSRSMPISSILTQRASLASLFENSSFHNMLRQSSIGNILQQSMQDTGGTKKVTTDDFIDSIMALPVIEDISEDEECPICMDDFKSIKGIKLECDHVFHKECISKWLRGDNRCPVCRHEYPSREVSLVTSEDISRSEEDNSGQIVETNDESSDSDNEDIQSIDEMNGLFNDTELDETTRTFTDIVPYHTSRSVEEDVDDVQLYQQMLFESIRDSNSGHDISGMNNESD
jgi:hypothetical protein